MNQGEGTMEQVAEKADRYQEALRAERRYMGPHCKICGSSRPHYRVSYRFDGFNDWTCFDYFCDFHLGNILNYFVLDVREVYIVLGDWGLPATPAIERLQTSTPEPS